jgi:hypothetical protein
MVTGSEPSFDSEPFAVEEAADCVCDWVERQQMIPNKSAAKKKESCRRTIDFPKMKRG